MVWTHSSISNLLTLPRILQGIFSNDLNIFKLQPERKAIHGAFLNEQGRIICDALILRPQVVHDSSPQVMNKEREFWIQVDKTQLPLVKKHLKKFSLRRKVQMTEITSQLRQMAIFSHFLVEKED